MKLNIAILLIMISITSFGKDWADGINITEVDSKHSLTDSINALEIKAADGIIILKNLPKNMEMRANYSASYIINENNEELKLNSKVIAAGVKYNYYGIKGWSLGVKGSLDGDHFIEAAIDGYDMNRYLTDKGINIIDSSYIVKNPDEYYFTRTDIGVKMFAEGVYKPIPEIALTVWNDVVVDKLETNDPVPHKDFRPTVTVSPKIIVEKKLSEGIKTLAEIYMENRKYFGRTIDVEGKQVGSYNKLVIKPHFIVEIEPVKGLKISAYNNITYEKDLAAKNSQIIFRISPIIKYENSFIKVGLEGGEYRFDDEIGLEYDYYEMVGYKVVGVPEFRKIRFKDYWRFESKVFSARSYMEVKTVGNLWVGTEGIYRYGDFIESISSTKSNDGHLIQKTIKPYLKYIKRVTENTEATGEIGYENISYNYKLIREMEGKESAYIKLGLKTKF